MRADPRQPPVARRRPLSAESNCGLQNPGPNVSPRGKKVGLELGDNRLVTHSGQSNCSDVTTWGNRG